MQRVEKRSADTHKAVNGNGSTLVDIDKLPDVNIATRPARRTPPPAPTQKSKPETKQKAVGVM